MNRGNIHSPYLKVLTVLSLVLLALSIYFHSTENFVIHRLLRGICSFAFLGVVILYQKSHVDWRAALFLIFHGGSSFASIWFESTKLSLLVLILNIVAFLVVIGALIPKINFRKISTPFAIFFIVLVLVNAYLLFSFAEMTRVYAKDGMHYILVLIHTLFVVIMGFLALLYTHVYSSRTSLLFTFFVFAIIFAEVFRAIGYYEFAYGDFAVHFARALVILAYFLLAYHQLKERNPAEVFIRPGSSKLDKA